MYQLDKSYGKSTYQRWQANLEASKAAGDDAKKTRHRDLSETQTTPDKAWEDSWEVRSFRDLMEKVAFLGSMNKRSVLFFRGQEADLEPLPKLFRSSWSCTFEPDEPFSITTTNRGAYWQELISLGAEVYRVCDEEGLPRWRGMRDYREVQWAVIQHYGLWPTPLIDVTSSLRVAASFALGGSEARATEKVGYLLIAGLPHTTGSITFDIDQQLSLARLSSACPPGAKRPHYQDGFLVGRFPIYEVSGDNLVEKSNLRRRLIAKFKLVDVGGGPGEGRFWDAAFPIVSEEATTPSLDRFHRRLQAEFGPRGREPVADRARRLST